MNVQSIHNGNDFKYSISKLQEDILFQQVVERIISDYVKLLPSKRHCESLLATIYKHTRNPAFFSPSSRFISLAKLSNHLLQSIGTMNQTHLFSIRHSAPILIPELHIELSIQLEIGVG